jgi:uncharacterized protein YqeY
MGLKEQISEEIKAAMKMPDKTRLETLRTLRAVLMEREIEKRGSGTGVTPDDEMAVMMSAAKKRKESIEQFEKGGRPELAEQERKELAIIQEYLPKQLLTGDIETIVDQVMKEIGASGPGDFGKLMPAVMKQLKGKADGRVIQDIVKKKLGAA